MALTRAVSEEIWGGCLVGMSLWATGGDELEKTSVDNTFHECCCKDKQRNRTVVGWVRRMKRKTCVLFLKTGEIIAGLYAVGIDPVTVKF